MFYYIQDHNTTAVLFIHSDPYLVANLKNGLLDCYTHCFIENSETVEKLQLHDNKYTVLIITPTGPVHIAITDSIRTKLNLIQARKPLFELLLTSAQAYRDRNVIGFHPTDPFSINMALSDLDRLDEYAQALNMSVEFAKEELSMYSTSAHIDSFKVFIICSIWKKRINSCTDVDTLQSYKDLIIDSFKLDPRMPDV